MRELLRMILPQGRFIYKTLLMFFFLTVTFLFFSENRIEARCKLLGLLKRPWLILFLLCSAYLLTCTLVGRYFTAPYKSVFGSFGLFRRNGRINTDMVANIIMFIPFVFLFLKAFNPPHPLKASLLLSICTTSFVELSQLIGWLGNFQIADFVHNILGGIIGFCLWYFIEGYSGKKK